MTDTPTVISASFSWPGFYSNFRCLFCFFVKNCWSQGLGDLPLCLFLWFLFVLATKTLKMQSQTQHTTSWKCTVGHYMALKNSRSWLVGGRRLPGLNLKRCRSPHLIPTYDFIQYFLWQIDEFDTEVKLRRFYSKLSVLPYQ